MEAARLTVYGKGREDRPVAFASRPTDDGMELVVSFPGYRQPSEKFVLPDLARRQLGWWLLYGEMPPSEPPGTGK